MYLYVSLKQLKGCFHFFQSNFLTSIPPASIEDLRCAQDVQYFADFKIGGQGIAAIFVSQPTKITGYIGPLKTADFPSVTKLENPPKTDGMKETERDLVCEQDLCEHGGLD